MKVDEARKTYELAKSLLSKGRKNEALDQYNGCIAEGRILEKRYPDFKEHKFDVSGTSMSVLELIQVCVSTSRNSARRAS